MTSAISATLVPRFPLTFSPGTFSSFILQFPPTLFSFRWHASIQSTGFCTDEIENLAHGFKVVSDSVFSGFKVHFVLGLFVFVYYHVNV